MTDKPDISRESAEEKQNSSPRFSPSNAAAKQAKRRKKLVDALKANMARRKESAKAEE